MKFQEEAVYEQGYRDSNKVKIVLTSDNGEKLYFQLRVELINLIVIEIGNIMTFSVLSPSQEEHIVSCNFAGLKPGYNQPVIKKSLKKSDFEFEDEIVDSLKYTVFKQEPKTGKTLFLTKNGWIKDKIYFTTDLKKFSPEETPTAKNYCKNENCKKEIKPGAKFCPFCGSTQGDISTKTIEKEPEAAPSKKICSNNGCSKEIKGSAKFCPFCGSKQNS